ncbi:DUF5789 family protein [Haloarcula onubensis]|uniref:DUF2795 domain-containing protein n=1 Tax=Haloarcula onubensis TaxID=2950539 RepID=A0ABU2FV29_9EURY|nr:hypothetical protein [Halomicroarcula sp. S3CR25-11]MDS0284622.1 hypothetical protein [Halomicroarcula sp. S3CR25-11]
MSNDSSDTETSSETREQGVEFGGLMDALEEHDYPTTQERLLEEYGDVELDLTDGEETLSSALAERELAEEQDTIEYESAGEVRQAVLNMVGDRAVGRTDYSDRGGSLQDDVGEGESESDQSL